MLSSDDQRLGRFYTPAGLARMVLALGLGGRAADQVSRIWDPTCGDGVFLRAASERGVPAARLVGSDLDEEALGTLRAALPATLVHSDLFELTPEHLGTFDVIVGNPPFLRTERVPAAARARMRARLSEHLGIPIPGSADVSLLALLWCCRFLRPGGRLAFVLPSTVLDVASGEPLRAWLASNYRVRLVVDSLVEPWFADAAVNTVVVVVDAVPPGSVAFARLRARADADLAPGVLGNSSDPRWTRRVRQAHALATPRWSPLLRAPDLWFALNEAAGAGLTPTGDCVAMSYGTKPGINGFFAPRPAPPVEHSCLRPFLRTLRHQHGYSVRQRDTEDRLFVVPPGQPPPRAAQWIADGQQRRSRRGVPFPEVPSVRGNRPWWRLPEPRTGTVLFPQFRASRHHVIHNPERVAVNNSAWQGTFVRPDDELAGIALLNSTWMALGAEVLGRTNLGEGLLTLYGPELKAVPMPDPARFRSTEQADHLAEVWAQLGARRAQSLHKEVAMPDRAALDAVVLAGLGLDPALARPIAEAAVALMDTRLNLASMRRAL